MGASNIIRIDLNKWTTQAQKARTYQGKNGTGCSTEYISKLIKHNKIKTLRIPELNIVLVEK